MGDGTSLATIETWKILSGLLSQIDSLGWSDSECLSWLRENAQAMQSGSPIGRVKSEKRNAEEAPGSKRKTKRIRLVHGLDDTGMDTTDGEDGSTAAGPMDDDGDGSDWDVDDSDCSSDTSRDDDDKDGGGNLTALFQELTERAASKKASCSTT